MLLNHVASQLKVAPENMPLTMEALYMGSLQSPFGGEYKRNSMLPDISGRRVWSSPKSVPWQEYRMPLLNRIHGAEFEFTAEGTTLTTRAELLLGE